MDKKDTKQKVSGKVLLDLFLCTFKIGAVTFGGGLVIIPMLEREFTERRNYVSKEDILDIVAISQSLPGVIATNASLMVGYRVGGVRAALVTALGVVMPSFIILSVLTYVYSSFADSAWMESAFTAISAAVAALMLNAAIRLGKSILKSPAAIVIMALVFVGAFHFGISGIYLIIASGVLGFLLSFTPYGFKRDATEEEGKGND